MKELLDFLAKLADDSKVFVVVLSILAALVMFQTTVDSRQDDRSLSQKESVEKLFAIAREISQSQKLAVDALSDGQRKLGEMQLKQGMLLREMDERGTRHELQAMKAHENDFDHKRTR